jgi:hypothetical protein
MSGADRYVRHSSSSSLYDGSTTEPRWNLLSLQEDEYYFRDHACNWWKTDSKRRERRASVVCGAASPPPCPPTRPPPCARCAPPAARLPASQGGRPAQGLQRGPLLCAARRARAGLPAALHRHHQHRAVRAQPQPPLELRARLLPRGLLASRKQAARAQGAVHARSPPQAERPGVSVGRGPVSGGGHGARRHAQRRQGWPLHPPQGAHCAGGAVQQAGLAGGAAGVRRRRRGFALGRRRGWSGAEPRS